MFQRGPARRSFRRGGFRRGPGKRLFHSSHFTYQSAIAVPGGTSFASPAVFDTAVVQCAELLASPAVPSNAVKQAKIARVMWSAIYALLPSNVASGVVNAYGLISDCLYQDGVSVGGAPVHGGQVFLHVKQLGTDTDPRTWPQRIVWRRQSYMAMVLNGESGRESGMLNDVVAGRLEPVVPRIKLDLDEALVHHIELTNPLTFEVIYTVTAMANVVYEVQL